jgi:hypothetical protein
MDLLFLKKQNPSGLEENKFEVKIQFISNNI